MKIIIKNMVCGRCRLVVRQILEKLNISFDSIELGTIYLTSALSKQDVLKLNKELSSVGLEIIDDIKSQQIEKIKLACLKYLNEKLYLQEVRLSEYLTKQLHKDYSHISRLFSSVKSLSIEKYYLNLRIEKVKELILYDRISFNEIAYELGFSSVAHLSKQFKSLTGLTLSEFRDEHKPHK